MTPLACVIVVAGELGERFDGVFAGMTVTAGSGTTTLSGDVEDHAEIQGVLRQLIDLGLDIIAVSTSPDVDLPPAP